MFSKNKIKILLIVGLLIIGTSFFIKTSLAVETPIPSITIQSEKLNYNNQEGGAWQVTKSVKWIEKGKARITIDVETIPKKAKDSNNYIFIIDTSTSISDADLENIKTSIKTIANDILTNSQNKVGVITFGSESNIILPLTNNIETIDDINNIHLSEGRSYYKALSSLESVLLNNQKNTTAIFITSGSPTKNTPNEVSQYKYLKDKYKNLTIAGVQYELGDTIIPNLMKISDYQLKTNKNDFYERLETIISNYDYYSTFSITESINPEQFEVIGGINKTTGIISKSEEKIIWDLKPLYSNQISKETLSFNIELKDGFQESIGTFKVDTLTNIISNINSNKENITAKKNLILSNEYSIIYDNNLPFGCQNTIIPNKKKHIVFDRVPLNKEKLECDGYQFKGWKIANENLTQIGNEYIIMPEEDVNVKAVWSKLLISKTAKGTISSVQTLYNLIKDQSYLDSEKSPKVTSTSGINFNKISSNSNGTGVYEMESTKNDEYPIYYYRGNVTNNSIIFADYCWRIIRTTETGGVKLIYDGKVTTAGGCNDNKSYSTISNYKSFNNGTIIDRVGYMYSDLYQSKTEKISKDWKTYVGKTSETIWDFTTPHSIWTEGGQVNYNTWEAAHYLSAYTSDSIIWNPTTRKYTLVNEDGSDVQLTEWSENSTGGVYTCFSKTEKSCDTAYYVYEISEKRAYCDELTNGQMDAHFYISDVISYDQNNNTYSLINPIDVNRTWRADYNNYKGYYFCLDKSNSCSTIYYIESPNIGSADAVKLENGETFNELYDYATNIKWRFGSEIDSNGNLVDPIEINPYNWNNTYTNINNHQYTCFSDTNDCNNKQIYYLYYVTSSNYHSILLPEGTTIENAVSMMLNSQYTNKENSNVKGDLGINGSIDKWYYDNIEQKNYSKYLEDTIFCNDRTIDDVGGWSHNNSGIQKTLYYSVGNKETPDLTCTNKVDKFTVSNDLGNGKLTYPVGLITLDEAILAGGVKNATNKTYYLYIGRSFFTLSPYSASTNVYMWSIGYNGNLTYTNSDSIRPVISLKPNVRIDSGDGTFTDPYRIEMDD